MAHRVTLIPGDGTGPELVEATRRVLEATGVEFDWDVQPAGEEVMHEHGGNPLPPTGVVIGPLRPIRVSRMLAITSSGSGVPWLAIAASPASTRSHSKPIPVASSTRVVASASSGPMPSPGIRVTRWAMRPFYRRDAHGGGAAGPRFPRTLSTHLASGDHWSSSCYIDAVASEPSCLIDTGVDEQPMEQCV